MTNRAKFFPLTPVGPTLFVKVSLIAFEFTVCATLRIHNHSGKTETHQRMKTKLLQIHVKKHEKQKPELRKQF